MTIQSKTIFDSAPVGMMAAGAAVAITGATLAILGFAGHHTFRVLGSGGCAGLLVGSYIGGSALLEAGLRTLKQRNSNVSQEAFDRALEGSIDSIEKAYILSKAALHGSEAQKEALLRRKIEILAYNKGNEFQIALPETSFEKMVLAATRIPRALLAYALDLMLLPFAGILVLLAAVGVDPNPSDDEIELGKTAIFMIHGSGFNEMEFLVGRAALKLMGLGGQCFSMNYAGVASNPKDPGIDRYAKEVLIPKLEKEIFPKTGKREVVLIGHSMGGLLAARLAVLAQTYNFTVKQVISIASPFRGTPTLNIVKPGPEALRQHDMSEESPFLARLTEDCEALEKASIEKGKPLFASFGSTTDYAVPNYSSIFSSHAGRHYISYFQGHYVSVISPFSWFQIASLVRRALSS